MENVQFIFCDPKKDLCKEWVASINKHVPIDLRKNFSILHGTLNDYKGKFDCIVSPAQSYCRLDGSFDLVIATMFNPNDIDSVTTVAQRHCYEKFNGQMPPGTASVVDMQSFNESRFGCKYLVLSPTMRMPSNVRWNRDVGYNCFFSILNAIKVYNAGGNRVKSVFVTGLGTGVGRIPAEVCAAQMAVAYKHFFFNLRKGFKTTSWAEATDFSLDIDETNRVLSNF